MKNRLAAAIGALVLLALAAPAAAQQRAPSAPFPELPPVRLESPLPFAAMEAPAPDPVPWTGGRRVVARTGAGTVGWLVGGLLGALAGGGLQDEDCGCDGNPGCLCEGSDADETLTGMAIGGALGAGLAAAAPGLGDGCGRTRRTVYALLGSALGTALGAAADDAVVPLGSVAGASAGALLCRASAPPPPG